MIQALKKITYLRAGGDAVIRSDRIIGIFDLDNTTTSKHTIAFLNHAEQEGTVRNLAADIPSSFVLTDDGVYLVQPAPRTLRGRLI